MGINRNKRTQVKPTCTQSRDGKESKAHTTQSSNELESAQSRFFILSFHYFVADYRKWLGQKPWRTVCVARCLMPLMKHMLLNGLKVCTERIKLLSQDHSKHNITSGRTRVRQNEFPALCYYGISLWLKKSFVWAINIYQLDWMNHTRPIVQAWGGLTSIPVWNTVSQVKYSGRNWHSMAVVKSWRRRARLLVKDYKEPHTNTANLKYFHFNSCSAAFTLP